MKICPHHALSLVLVLSGMSFVVIAKAEVPVYRLSSSCDMPTMPKRGAPPEEWSTYRALVIDYNECLGEKASVYGLKTKEVFETVGSKVTDWAGTAADWVKK